MGAWGTGVLDNDSAADWLQDLQEQPEVMTVAIALSTGADGDGYLEVDEAAPALVAAEIVAAALGRPASGVDERVLALAQRWPELSDHAGLAMRAVERVEDPERSEVADLWEDAQNSEWAGVMEDLRRRLDLDG